MVDMLCDVSKFPLQLEIDSALYELTVMYVMRSNDPCRRASSRRTFDKRKVAAL